jgi:predicted enzyme related to lactoylglutathione lyase
VTELCQFLGGGWKVIIAVKQHSQTLLAVRNKGGELISLKKDPPAIGERSKKGKKVFF